MHYKSSKCHENGTVACTVVGGGGKCFSVKCKEILLCLCHVGCRGIDVGNSQVDVKEVWDNVRVTKLYMAQ